IAYGIVGQRPQVIWVTHHAGFGTDSMTVPESVTIASAFTTFAPGGCIDRGDIPIPVYTTPPYIALSRQKWDSVIAAHVGDTAYASVGITNNYNAVTRTLNCTVNSTFNFVPRSGDLRINIYLVEDSVVGYGHGYDQKSYFNTTVGHPFYGKGDSIVGYVHHRVVRKVPGGAWGISGIIPSSPVVGTKYSYTFSNISVPAGWKENYIDIVAFVSYYNSNAKLRQVVNSNHKMMKDISVDGVNEISQDENIVDVNFFPNPVSDKLSIEISSSVKTNSSFQILNPEGSLVKTVELKENKTDVDLKGLANGIYFCRTVTYGQNSRLKKLMVMH
ncbi:MAG: T9SS type A sorting domain-containing protein, partial [Bacteroidia bacterium]